jgi:hypothetical protein
MNIIKAFRKDLSIAEKNAIFKPNKNKIIFFIFLTFAYLYCNAIYKYSQDYTKRLEKIENLKREGKYILE